MKITNLIDQGDQLVIDTLELREGEQYLVKNRSKQIEFHVVSPLCQMDLDAIKVGGRINLIKNKGSKTAALT